MKKRIVSCLVALAVVMGGFPGPAWAGESSLCPHHTAHTAECCPDGAGSPCSYVCGVCSVEAAIDSLPEAENASGADHEAAQSAWDAWEALSPEEQTQVGNFAKLESLLAFYSEQTTPLQEETVTLYLEDGGVTISDDWYIHGANMVPYNGNYIITQKNAEEPVKNTVSILLEADNTADITIRDIFIDASSSGGAAISILNGSKVALTLEGTNRVVSGENYAGIMTGGDRDNELTIRGSGSLEARGGDYGAGIGGALNYEVGTIRIESGTVSAYGGKGAAGIGGGDTVKSGMANGGGAGTIIISGGTVYAEGTENPEETNAVSAYGAAGIGGGYFGGNSTIKILGGDVTAVGAAKAPCIGNANISYITISGGTVRTQRKPDDAVKNAHEIGGYQDFYFSAPASLDSGENGRAVIYVSGPGRISKWNTVRETWNGIVWEGDAGTVYGSVDLSEDGLTIGAGQTLEVPGSSDPESDPALTVTEEGFRNDGTITGTGLVMMDGKKYRIEDNRLVPLTQDLPVIEVSVTGDPSKIYDGTAAVLPESGYTVTGSDAAVTVLYKAKAGPDSAYTASAPVNAGEYTVKVACGGVEAEKDFTISQAAPEAAVIPVSVQYGGTAEQTVDLSAAIAPYLLPGDAPVCSVGSFPENSYLTADAVQASSNTLSFVLASGAEASGGEAVTDIPVTVSGFTNYTPLSLTVRVTVTFKTALDISGLLSLAISGWTWGELASQPVLSCADAEIQLEEAAIRYIYSGTQNDGTVVTDAEEAPAHAGSYTVTAFYHSRDYVGSASAAFTIHRAACQGAPACGEITAGGKTLADVPLTAGTLAPAGGEVRWRLDGSTPVEKNKAYEWVYFPANANDYEVLSGELVVWRDDGGTPPERPDPPHWEGPSEDDERPDENRPSPNAPGREPGSPAEAAVPDPGDRIATTEHPDGSRVIEVKRADGSASTTAVSASGQMVATVELSESAAAQSGVIELPMPSVPSVRDAAQAPSVTVNGPEGAVVTVEIPVENAVPGTVAVAVSPDGTRKVLRQTVPSENGVVIAIPAGTTVQILDNSKAFTDVPAGHGARDAVDFVTSRELFSGTDAASFSPDQGMTRGMLMTVLARLDGVDTAGGRIWYEKGVAWAVAQGISSGEAPGQNVTCEQAVTMLYRYAGDPPAAGSLPGFPTDAVSVSDYAVDAVNWALENGLLTDADGGLMVPKSVATRGQGATILMRFVEWMG